MRKRQGNKSRWSENEKRILKKAMKLTTSARVTHRVLRQSGYDRSLEAVRTEYSRMQRKLKGNKMPLLFTETERLVIAKELDKNISAEPAEVCAKIVSLDLLPCRSVVSIKKEIKRQKALIMPYREWTSDDIVFLIDCVDEDRMPIERFAKLVNRNMLDVKKQYLNAKQRNAENSYKRYRQVSSNRYK